MGALPVRRGVLFNLLRRPNCHERRNGLPIDEDGLVIVVGKQNSDDMFPRDSRAVTETGNDKRPSEIAVHTVVGTIRNIAAVALRIDLHMDMAAARVIAAGTGGQQTQIAFHDDADCPFGVPPEGNGCAFLRPDDGEGWGFIR